MENLTDDKCEFAQLKLEQDPSYDYNLLQTGDGVDI